MIASAPNTAEPGRPVHWIFRGRARWLLLALLATPLLLFLVAPWSLTDKTYALCSGVCAQQVTHTFRFAGGLLPLDARCSGIYGGFLITTLFVAALGRAKKGASPPVRYLALAGFLIALMGFDGVNSLLKDIRFWYLYEPDNRLRLITGLGAGLSLALILLPIAQSALWKVADREPILRNAYELVALVGFFGAYYLLLIIRPDWLYAPTALFMTTGLFLTFTLLNSVIAASAIWPSGPRGVRWRDLLAPVGIAYLLTMIQLMAFAGFRFLIERGTGIDLRTYLS